jgi:hypothetical protein
MKSSISRIEFDRLVERHSQEASGIAIDRQVVKLEGQARVRNWLLVNAVTQTAPLLRRIASCAGADERLQHRARIKG